MIHEYIHSTDEFMFKSFDIHSRIFTQKNVDDYYMVSSGTNQLPLTAIWKESIIKEIESDFLYRWYTCSNGFQCITRAIKVYEDMLSSYPTRTISRTPRNVCMSIGGSSAASMVFDYIKKEYDDCTVILVGANYSLYDRLAKKLSFSIKELHGKNNFFDLPLASDFDSTTFNGKSVFVFSVPNNPSGDIYTQEQFYEIVKRIKAMDGFIVFDKVCKIDISSKIPPTLESVITDLEFWQNCAVVNSFSKSDSTAGMRIGYIYSNVELISYCSSINADSIMNPPTFPAFPIFLTCLFRCMFFSERVLNDVILKRKYVELYYRMFLITTAIIPPLFLRYVNNIFENIDLAYSSYVSEQLDNEKIMRDNYLYTLSTFSDLIAFSTELKNGFNFCIGFSRPFAYSELELIEMAIKKTGVAILTESSFTICNPSNRFAIRFSSACKKNGYMAAIDRLFLFLSKEGLVNEKCND